MTRITQAPALAPELATAMEVNRIAGTLRGEFEGIKVDRPVPFIVWKYQVDEDVESRLQRLLCNNGTRQDAELLPMLSGTLKDMKRGKLVRAKLAA